MRAPRSPQYPVRVNQGKKHNEDLLSMSAIKVFSEAYNISPLASSVNSRTGGVDISIPLAKISSGLQFPAAFTLALQSKPGHIGLPRCQNSCRVI